MGREGAVSAPKLKLAPPRTIFLAPAMANIIGHMNVLVTTTGAKLSPLPIRWIAIAI